MVAGLDSWQSMALDVSLALKYKILEREEKQSQLEIIVSAIDNVIRAQGAKIKQRKPQPSLIQPYRDPSDVKAIDDLPNVSEVLQALGGGITIVNEEGLEEYNGKHS